MHHIQKVWHNAVVKYNKNLFDTEPQYARESKGKAAKITQDRYVKLTLIDRNYQKVRKHTFISVFVHIHQARSNAFPVIFPVYGFWFLQRAQADYVTFSGVQQNTTNCIMPTPFKLSSVKIPINIKPGKKLLLTINFAVVSEIKREIKKNHTM